MSLEGLNSLIQLESTRLEGARAVTQNFQSVASTVQQQGMQTASSKNNLAMSRIDSQYTKECAEADVRKLERRLSRERASEALSKNIAGIALVANAVGNLGHMFNDINGRQKLGDNPEYLKTPPIDPNNATVSVTTYNNSAANSVFVSNGKVPDETVYLFETGASGSNVGSLPIAASISEYDKERILGNEYTKMKEENGGKSLNFAEIRQKNPELAKKLVQDRGHGVGHDEAANLMKVLNVNLSYTGNTSSMNEKQVNDKGTKDSNILASLSSITGGNDKDNSLKIAAISAMTNDQKKEIFGNPNITQESAVKALEDPEFVKKLNEKSKSFPNGNVYYSEKNEVNKDNEDIQINNNGLTFKVKDISPADKKNILGDKYEKMSFDQIFKEEDIGPKNAALLIAGVLKNDPTKNGNTDTKELANLIENNPSGAAKAIKELPKNPKLEILSESQATENMQNAGLNQRLVESRDSLRELLGTQGKIDNRSGVDKVKDVGKAAVNFLVKTMEESVPYFQAYLKAKDRADRTYEELIAAMEKLNAASKKLKSIEMQIDVFSGRGA